MYFHPRRLINHTNNRVVRGWTPVYQTGTSSFKIEIIDPTTTYVDNLHGSRMHSERFNMTSHRRLIEWWLCSDAVPPLRYSIVREGRRDSGKSEAMRSK